MIGNEWGIKIPNTNELIFSSDVLESIICFSLGYDLTESGGSGFLADNRGTLITACHVLRNRVEEWGKLEAVPVSFRGQPVVGGLSLIEANPEKDYAILRSDKLSGAPHLSIGKKDKLDKESAYWVFGYPSSFNEFPFRKTLAVSRGEFVGEEVRFRPFLQRLSCAIWNGFSGGPVVDRDGFVVGIAVAASISRTSDDIADILPLCEIAYP